MSARKNRSKFNKKSKKNKTNPDFYSEARLIKKRLSEKNINKIGRETGFFKRIRKIKPFEFLVNFIQAFSGGNQINHLSDILGHIFIKPENL